MVLNHELYIRKKHHSWIGEENKLRIDSLLGTEAKNKVDLLQKEKQDVTLISKHRHKMDARIR